MFNKKLQSPVRNDIKNSFHGYRVERRNHWNKVSIDLKDKNFWNRYYHNRLKAVYHYLVTPGQKILEIGCSTGDLLSTLKPSIGVGVDFSEKMIKYAMEKHPELHFIVCDAHELGINDSFDIIILSDIVNDLWDVQAVFDQIKYLMTKETRLIINFHNYLWEFPLIMGQHIRIMKKVLPQNWLTFDDIRGFLKLTNMEIIKTWNEILLPLNIPILSTFINRFLTKLWPIRNLALSNFMVARPLDLQRSDREEPMVSVVIPARNEAGNVDSIFRRIPEMGRKTELIFIEGHSSDDTYSVIEEAIIRNPSMKCRLFRQSGRGKGDAVRLGFEKAKGDVLMILDADLTVPPEQLPRFYNAITSGKGEFINGVRLVYPMEKHAMRYLNLMGNKFFSLAFKWLLGQPIKDTLCGTKVLWKRDYERIRRNRSYFGDFDPFGDFDLLFGAAKLNLKIIEVPIRYAERRYGNTNISRWKHGMLLLRMVIFAIRRIKFT